jgi:hypothetical protein
MATTLTAEVYVKLNIDNTVYDINLGIPSTNPSPDSPYKFNITTPGAEAGETQDLVNFAMGGADYVYVAVSPPESIMKEVPVVEDLSVVVNEGNYDPATGKFTTA